MRCTIYLGYFAQYIQKCSTDILAVQHNSRVRETVRLARHKEFISDAVIPNWVLRSKGILRSTETKRFCWPNGNNMSEVKEAWLTYNMQSLQLSMELHNYDGASSFRKLFLFQSFQSNISDDEPMI